MSCPGLCIPSSLHMHHDDPALTSSLYFSTWIQLQDKLGAVAAVDTPLLGNELGDLANGDGLSLITECETSHLRVVLKLLDTHHACATNH
jgi:hypothetical protein